MSHTKEPWRIEGKKRNGDIQIVGSLGDAVCEVYEDGGNIDEKDARRIVACVNACAGLSTDMLENIAMTGGLVERFALLNQTERQRDELLAALSALCFKIDLEDATAMDYPEYDKALAVSQKVRGSDA